MNKKIISSIVLSMFSICSVNALAQSAPVFNKDIQVKANIQAGCYLSADNVNFGVLMMPIRDQTAISSMSVLCSNNASYTIAPTYSNKNVISGTVTSTNGTSSNSFFLWVDGKRISNSTTYDIICYSNEVNRFAFGSDIVAKAYGYSAGGWIDSPTRVNKVCNNWYPNSATYSSLTFGEKPGGKLIGSKGRDAIIYVFEDPKDKNKVWSTANVYQTKGNGETQNIIITGKIQKADNQTYYLTNDVYNDVATFTISY